MTRTGRLAVLLFATATLAGYAQSPPAAPSFEVASIKPAFFPSEWYFNGFRLYPELSVPVWLDQSVVC